MRGAPAVVLLVALAACSFFDSEKPRPVQLYSPNGEPLNGGRLGTPTCADAMTGWFDRVDAGHDGAISLPEFLADARRQFAAMDLNHDGVLTPSVLARYRAPYLLAMRVPRERSDDSDQGRRGGGGGGLFRRGDNGGIPQDVADPVMLADVRLRNQVTLDDFMAYARRNFADLDRNHDGRVDKAELLHLCAKPGS